MYNQIDDAHEDDDEDDDDEEEKLKASNGSDGERLNDIYSRPA